MSTPECWHDMIIAAAIDREEDDALDRALQDSFPASDAPSAVAPSRIGNPSPRARDSSRLAIDRVVAMLTSRDARLRQQGYALYRDGLEDALYQSCLNYGALVHGFTHPLLSALEEAIERWAAASERTGS
jgi:hypothetical protein